MKWIVVIILFLFLAQLAKAETVLGSGATISNGTVIMLAGINTNVTVMGDYNVSGLEIFPTYFLINVSSAPLYASLPYSYSDGVMNVTPASNTDSNLYINSNTPDGNSCSVDGNCVDGHCIHSVCRAATTYCGDGYCDAGESCSIDCPSPTSGGCLSAFNVSYPASVSARVNESSMYHVVITNTGSCVVKPVSLSAPDWLRVMPNVSSVLRSKEQFAFNLTLLPLAEGNYTVTLALKGGIERNYTISLAVTGQAQECPECPPSTEWSDCTGNQTRTSYRCDNYACVGYEETRQCGTPAPLYIWVMIIGAITATLIIVKLIKRKR